MIAKEILNELLVELFNHILYLEEQNLQSQGINLTMNEIHTIEAIRDSNGAIMSEVANKLMITLGTLTTSIKRLELKGYVKRVKTGTDGRHVKIEVTESAMKVMKVHDKFHKNMIDTVLDDLSVTEEKILLNSLVKIKDYFKRNYQE